MGSYNPEETFCPEDRVWQGEGFLFLRISHCFDEFSQGNKHLFKMGGIKFFKSSVSLAIQNCHQLSTHQYFDGHHQGGLHHQPLWKEN